MTATITHLPNAPKVSWIEIKHLDGRSISLTHSLHWSEKWNWITRTLMGETGCDYEDIDVRDTDEGDIITIRGVDFADGARVMSKQHLQTALDALEFQKRFYEEQLSREPRTRNREPNPHLHLLQCINSIAEAREALAERVS